MCFPLLDFDKWNAVHANFGHCLHYMVPAGIILASLLPKARKKTDSKKIEDNKVDAKSQDSVKDSNKKKNDWYKKSN